MLDKGDVGIEVLERSLLDFSKELVRHDPSKIKVVVEELLKR